ncbi:MAG: dihydropteroate synthase [Polyangiaceae bacterium]|nr:dihydropteroate synthase [Polyangiaceae bacterium]
MSALRALINDSGARVLVMGVLNRTPDSFSDGGAYTTDEAAIERAKQMIGEGADIIDIGAESTRPGSQTVSDGEQIARLGTVVASVATLNTLVSIDTTSPAVAEHALMQGATIVNCVDPTQASVLGALCKRYGAALILMHCRGSMSKMRGFSSTPDDAYTNVVEEVIAELQGAAQRAMASGLARENIVLDPGFGFAKNATHSLELLGGLGKLCTLDFPVLSGPSRKSFIAHAARLGAGPQAVTSVLAPATERLGGTIAALIASVAAGVKLVRVHDVREARQALDVWTAIESARTGQRASVGRLPLKEQVPNA